MELNICPRCGANNSELARFCYACGTPLTSADSATAPQTAEPTDPTAYQAQAWSEPPVGGDNGQMPSAGYTQQLDQQPGNYQAPPQYPPYGVQQPTQQPGSYQMPPQGAPYGQPYQPNPYQMPPQGYPPYGQPYQQPVYLPLGYRQKSRVAAGILGILLGVFGVHNFYLGYTGKAVAQLLITILSGFILSFVPFIWGMIEGIMLLCGRINVDGRHVPLSD